MEMDTLNNNSATEIDQGGHRGKYLLLDELRSPWDLLITSHCHNLPVENCQQ